MALPGRYLMPPPADASKPDTAAALKALDVAYDYHREVMGALSHAKLMLQAAGGVLPMEPGEELPYPADDPRWLDGALDSVDRRARAACGGLDEAIEETYAHIEALRRVARASGQDTREGTNA